MFDWLRRLFKRKDIPSWAEKDAPPFFSPTIEIPDGEEIYSRRYIPKRYVPVAGSQATHQDIGRFMKHGRQSKGYRQSIKAKVQPEEED